MKTELLKHSEEEKGEEVWTLSNWGPGKVDLVICFMSIDCKHVTPKALC